MSARQEVVKIPDKPAHIIESHRNNFAGFPGTRGVGVVFGRVN